MTEQTIKVLDCQERSDPKFKLHGREGYAYTVELTDKQGKASVREIYMFCSEASDENYDLVSFVKIGVEGDNFYKTPSTERWTDEIVSPEIKAALKHYDETPFSTENRDALAIRAGSKVHHAPKPN